MTGKKKPWRVRQHFERLRDLSHEKPWRLAEPASASPNDGTPVEELRHHSQVAEVAGPGLTSKTTPRRTNTMARAGFVLAYIATLAAAMSLDLFSTATSFDDVPWAPWLIALLLGLLAMAIFEKAMATTHRFTRFGRARWSVAAGLVLAVVGAFVVALPILALAANLGEGL